MDRIVRRSDVETLADHHAGIRNTTEVKRMLQSENTRNTAARHKWYLVERHGMINNLLVPDHRLNKFLPVLSLDISY